MRSYWVFSILASILILGTLVVQDVYSTPPQKPEKLIIQDLRWNSTSQEFLGEYLVQFGTATAGSSEKFVLVTTLTIDNTEMLLGVKTVDSHPQEVLDLVAAATGDLYQSMSVTSPFDPVARGLEEPVDVKVEAKILNSQGNLVVVAEPKTFEDIDLSPPSEICDDKIDNDGDGYVDDKDPDCIY